MYFLFRIFPHGILTFYFPFYKFPMADIRAYMEAAKNEEKFIWPEITVFRSSENIFIVAFTKPGTGKPSFLICLFAEQAFI